MSVDPGTFREALARFPSGVTVVTTLDAARRKWGFTASAFSSVSLDPPQVLVCIDQGADCHKTFAGAGEFVINILAEEQEAVARRFAEKGGDKFAGFVFTPNHAGQPVLEGAHAVLHCRAAKALPAGDHTILLADVDDAHLGAGAPALYYGQTFCRLHDGVRTG